MTLNDKIRYTSKDLILAYVHFIKLKIDEEDKGFIRLGVDSDYDLYRLFFIEAIKKALGSDRVSVKRFARKPMESCVSELKDTITRIEANDFCNKNTEILVDTCELIFNKVVEGAKNSEHYRM